MKNYIWILVFIFLSGCKSQIKQEKEEEKLLTFEVDLQQLSEKGFDDFYELEEVIKLETTDRSILGDIKKILAGKDRLFISSWNHPGILIFNRDGKYLYQINKQGKGPGEYLEITDVLLTEDPEELIVYDRSGRFLHYDWEGNFLREGKMDSYISHVERLPDGGWLTDHALAHTSSFRDSLYILRASDSSGQYIQGTVALPVTKYILPLRMVSNLYQNEGRYYGIPVIENTIYEYNYRDAEFSPRYIYQLRDYPVPDASKLSPAEMIKPFIYDYYIFNSEYIGENTILLIAWRGGVKENSMLTLVTDKKSKKTEVFQAIVEDKKNELPLHRYLQHTGFKGKVVAYTHPLELQQRTFSDAHSVGARLSEELNEESNPVLLIYKEKESF